MELVDLCLRSPFWESISAFPVGIQHINCISRGKPNSTYEKICQQGITKRIHPENRHHVNHFKTCRQAHLIITALCLCNTKVIGVASFPEDARETDMKEVFSKTSASSCQQSLPLENDDKQMTGLETSCLLPQEIKKIQSSKRYFVILFNAFVTAGDRFTLKIFWKDTALQDSFKFLIQRICHQDKLAPHSLIFTRAGMFHGVSSLPCTDLVVS